MRHKKNKNNNQEVYYLNPWEFLTLWEIKLLPADESAVEKLAKSQFPGLPKKHKAEDRVQALLATIYIYKHAHILKQVLAYGLRDRRR